MRGYTVPEIRIAMDIRWWERQVERLYWRGQPIAERWEWRDGTVWRKYWRRDGSLPRGTGARR